jgi:hypothetical protein
MDEVTCEAYAQAVAEVAKRTIAQIETRDQQFAYLSDLFDKQLEVIAHPARVKTVRTGRRGGKTHLITRWLFKAAQDRAGCKVLFVALTRPSAKRLVWSELQKVNKLYGLGATFNGQDLTVTLLNGSQIWLAGATRGPEIEKLRGHAFDLVCCDESGSFGDELEYLLGEVLDAALEDYQGTIVLVGTPNAAAAGAFFDRDNSAADHIAHFSWTVLDNPKFPLWAGKADWQTCASAWWQDKVRREGWAVDDPVMNREWLAKWVRDTNRLVYRCDDSQLVDELPPGEWSYVIGCDLGWNDQKTIVVLACNDNTRQLCFVDCFAQSALLIDDYAEIVKEYQADYNPVAMVCDAGALGKDLVEHMRAVHSIPFLAADKKQKGTNQQFMNGALGRKRLKFAPRARDLYRQMSILQWADQRRMKTDQSFREDLCDAALYAFRYATNVYKPDFFEELPQPGTAEYAALEQAAMKARAMRQAALGKLQGDDDAFFGLLK